MCLHSYRGLNASFQIRREVLLGRRRCDCTHCNVRHGPSPAWHVTKCIIPPERQTKREIQSRIEIWWSMASVTYIPRWDRTMKPRQELSPLIYGSLSTGPSDLYSSSTNLFLIPKSSTSKIKVDEGGMTGGCPRTPVSSAFLTISPESDTP